MLLTSTAPDTLLSPQQSLVQPHTLENTMRTKAPRIIIATVTVALMSLGGFAAPAEAGKLSQQRTGWCC